VTEPGDREALVRRSIEAWNEDDWEEGLRSIWSRDGMIVSPEGWPESGPFEGWDAMVEQWRRIKSSWAEEHVELLSLKSGADDVLAEMRWSLRGEASGALLEVQAWILCEFDQDRISKMTYFLDGEEARRAAEGA
jgi:hypothetical protein